MKGTRFCRRAGGLLLAAAIGLCAGCAGDEPPVSGQVSNGDWGEHPGANDTLPWEFTETTGEATTTSVGFPDRDGDGRLRDERVEDGDRHGHYRRDDGGHDGHQAARPADPGGIPGRLGGPITRWRSCSGARPPPGPGPRWIR